MPPRRHDSEGNPFRIGWIYEYSYHKLKLISMKPDKSSGEFELIEEYGSLHKGWIGQLNFDKGFKPLYASESLQTNKGASILLAKEW